MRLKIKDIEVGQVLRPIPGGTIDADRSERYKVTRKIRGAILAMNSKGHEVVLEQIHVGMLQIDSLTSL